MKLGIDLGSYNSAAAYTLDNQQAVQVISSSGTNFQGKNFPSFVKFNAEGKVEGVGETARNALAMNPLQVVWGAKRLVGLSYSTAMDEGELVRFAYPIERGPGDSILIPQGPLGRIKYTPETILRFILAQIKSDAENRNVNPLLALPTNGGHAGFIQFRAASNDSGLT